MKIIKYLILFSILFIISFIHINRSSAQSLLNTSDYKKDFAEANKLYNEQQYFKAIDYYKKIINNGLNNGYLYYNLGNAYLKNDQVGKAILNYQNALIYQPRNVDIKTNLQYALDETKDQFSTEETIEPILQILIFWYYNLNITELIIITILSNLIMCTGFIYQIFNSNNILKISNYVVLTIFIVLFTSTMIKIYNNYNVSEGVVVVKETDIKSGYDDSYATVFKLHEGTIFKISETKGNWYKILLSNGQKGWINKNSIGLVNSHT